MSRLVHLTYFASLKAARGLSEESVDTACDTLGELYEELQAKHGFALGRESVLFARNDEMSQQQEPFEAGDRISLYPPFAGG